MVSFVSISGRYSAFIVTLIFFSRVYGCSPSSAMLLCCCVAVIVQLYCAVEQSHLCPVLLFIYFFDMKTQPVPSLGSNDLFYWTQPKHAIVLWVWPCVAETVIVISTVFFTSFSSKRTINFCIPRKKWWRSKTLLQIVTRQDLSLHTAWRFNSKAFGDDGARGEMGVIIFRLSSQKWLWPLCDFLSFNWNMQQMQMFQNVKQKTDNRNWTKVFIKNEWMKHILVKLVILLVFFFF